MDIWYWYMIYDTDIDSWLDNDSYIMITAYWDYTTDTPVTNSVCGTKCHVEQHRATSRIRHQMCGTKCHVE